MLPHTPLGPDDPMWFGSVAREFNLRGIPSGSDWRVARDTRRYYVALADELNKLPFGMAEMCLLAEACVRDGKPWGGFFAVTWPALIEGSRSGSALAASIAIGLDNQVEEWKEVWTAAASAGSVRDRLDQKWKVDSDALGKVLRVGLTWIQQMAIMDLLERFWIDLNRYPGPLPTPERLRSLGFTRD